MHSVFPMDGNDMVKMMNMVRLVRNKMVKMINIIIDDQLNIVFIFTIGYCFLILLKKSSELNQLFWK